MHKGPISYLFGMMIVAYVGWIVFASNPQQRISRGCRPIDWMGRLSVSLMAFIHPPWESGTHHLFTRGDYVCRYSVWRLIYGEAWDKAHPKNKSLMDPATTSSSAP